MRTRGKKPIPILAALLTAALVSSTGTMACPLCNLCNSPTGQQVRAGIFDDGSWGTLAAVVSPFPVLLLCLAVYHYGIPKLWRRTMGQKPIESEPNQAKEL